MESLSRFGKFLMLGCLLFLCRNASASGFTVESLNETNAQLQVASMRLAGEEQPSLISQSKQFPVAASQSSSVAATQSASDINLYVAGSPFPFFRYDATTGEFLGKGQQGPLGTTSIALGGPDANVFVSLPDVSEVLQYTKEGVFLGVVAGSNTDIRLFNLSAIAFGSDGDLYIGDRGDEDINELGRILRLRFNPITSQYESLGVFAENGIEFSPNDFVFGRNGNLFVSDFGTQSVLEFNGATGQLVGAFASDPRITAAGALDFAPNGDLFLVNSTSSQSTEILRFDSSGNFVGVFASAAAFSDLAFGPDGLLYVSDVSDIANARILRYNIDTGLPPEVFISSGLGGLVTPSGLTFGPAPIPEPTAGFVVPSLFVLLIATRKSRLRS